MAEKDKEKDKDKHKEEQAKAEDATPEKAENDAAGNGQQPETPAQPDGSQPMVALSMDEYDALQKQIEQSQAKAGEYHEGWQRERADFVNYKRRVESQTQQMQETALATVVKKYLVVLDDIERALKMRPGSEEGAAWAGGIELIYRKLLSMLEAEGVKRMDAENETFDPNRHEALALEDSPDHASGEIVEVIQPGYLLGDRVIRPALVRVAK
jgi:molecular chaperone GrpE